MSRTPSAAPPESGPSPALRPAESAGIRSRRRRRAPRLPRAWAVPAVLLAALAALAVAPPLAVAAARQATGRGAAGDADAGGWTESVRLAPAPPPLPTPAGPLSPARKYFTDVELVDQDGRTHRLYSDLLQGKTVVIGAFFTSCTGACPVLVEKLAAIQAWLGDRLGKDVFLLSFTVDPQTDSPARLKQYAERLGARPGWFFLTGKKENVEWALYKLGHYVEQKEAHSNLLVIGNESTGLWKKVFGLARSEDLIRSLDAVLHDRG
jgi:protein SCO1/2